MLADPGEAVGEARSDDDAISPAGSGRALAAELARRLGSAVVGMRYPVAEPFAAALAAELYSLLFARNLPLAMALASAMATAGAGHATVDRPALSLGAPALFSASAIALRLVAPQVLPRPTERSGAGASTISASLASVIWKDSCPLPGSEPEPAGQLSRQGSARPAPRKLTGHFGAGGTTATVSSAPEIPRTVRLQRRSAPRPHGPWSPPVISQPAPRRPTEPCGAGGTTAADNWAPGTPRTGRPRLACTPGFV